MSTSLLFRSLPRRLIVVPKSAIAPVTFRALASMSSNLDIKSQVIIDHDNIRELYQRYKSTSDHDEKMRIANTMIREIGIHGDAEEISIYNVLEKTGKKDLAAHSKDEHHEIKALFYKADTSSGTEPDFDSVLDKAFTTFDQHAKEEEAQGGILDAIVSSLTPEENHQETINFLKARKSVPPRPHPMAPQTGGVLQKAAGLQATFHDKVVNAIRGTEYVDLKTQHPDV